jgi:hypothetical protein
MKNLLPNFLIVGAAKSGTTSLYHALKQHPDIYMSEKNKEPHFFCRKSYGEVGMGTPMAKESIKYLVQDWEEYKNLFKSVKNEKMIGEASTGYLYKHEESIYEIKKNIGNVKIIIILRNPVDRAFSAYSHLKQNQFETLDFNSALRAEKERKSKKWDNFFMYADYGMYCKQVEAYMVNFSNVKIVLFDDFKSDTKQVVADIYNFLGVNDDFIPNFSVKFNATGKVRYKFINNFFHQKSVLKTAIKPLLSIFIPKSQRKIIANKIKNKNLMKQKIPPNDRSTLEKKFNKEIDCVESLIGRNLDCWRKI